MTEFRDWMSLFAAIGQLTVAVVALSAGASRRRRSVLTRPLAALCFALFGWNFSTLAGHVFQIPLFWIADSFFTALSPPLTLEVVVTFVGKSKKHRAARALAWVVFGGLAVFGAKLEELPWAIWFLSAWLPTLLFELVLLVAHLRRNNDPREKARARTVLAALAIGATLSTSDVLRGLGLPMPYLGSLGTLIAAVLFLTLAVRFELFDKNVEARTTLYVLGMIGVFVTLYLIVFRVFAGSLAVLAAATALVTLLVVAVARELATGLAEARERTRRLTVLGRFAAQMSHDIKGPMAALLGATQAIEGERDEAARRDLLGLVSEQAKRIVAIVDRYDRMGRVEPRKTLVRVDEVVRSVARAHALGDGALRLDAAIDCEADRDLVESAVENVVRNAIEASGSADGVHVETARTEAAVVVRVVDRGRGMDARDRERAFEDFFTTKPDGSGLGLAFVRRVLVAHGGEVALTSELGKGTTVEMRLPLGPSASLPPPSAR